MKTENVSKNRAHFAVSLWGMLLILSVVVGEVTLPFHVLAQAEMLASSPMGKTKKYPVRPRIDGLELRSLGDSSQIRRPGRDRFAHVLTGKAVLDKKTGLVWERSPDAERRNWSSSVSYCSQKVVGGRKGWRIPTFAELSSLMDPNNPNGNPDLPIGHPFKNIKPYLSPRNVELAFYWLANANADGPGGAWDVMANDGVVDIISEENDFLVWCVIGERRILP